MLKLWVTNNVFESDLNLNVFTIMSFPRKVCIVIKVHFCMSNNNYYFVDTLGLYFCFVANDVKLLKITILNFKFYLYTN